MTTLLEAAEKALAALEHPVFQGANEAEEALRIALKQHKQQEDIWNNLERYTQEVRVLLKRQPLTVEEIENINRDLPLLHMQAKKGSVAVIFARAIERAHGIGEKE